MRARRPKWACGAAELVPDIRALPLSSSIASEHLSGVIFSWASFERMVGKAARLARSCCPA